MLECLIELNDKTILITESKDKILLVIYGRPDRAKF